MTRVESDWSFGTQRVVDLSRAASGGTLYDEGTWLIDTSSTSERAHGSVDYYTASTGWRWKIVDSALG
jgi:hypothetical protein